MNDNDDYINRVDDTSCRKGSSPCAMRENGKAHLRIKEAYALPKTTEWRGARRGLVLARGSAMTGPPARKHI